jgi:hypothetical protein
MPKHIELNRETFDPPRRESIRGVEVEVSLSPYDVPDAVSSRFDAKYGKLIVRFAYAASEPLKNVRLWEHVVLVIGSRTLRLHGVEFDLFSFKEAHVGEAVSAERLAHEIGQAIDALSRTPGTELRAGNYRLAREVINTLQDCLFSTPAVTSPDETCPLAIQGEREHR